MQALNAYMEDQQRAHPMTKFTRSDVCRDILATFLMQRQPQKPASRGSRKGGHDTASVDLGHFLVDVEDVSAALAAAEGEAPVTLGEDHSTDFQDSPGPQTVNTKDHERTTGRTGRKRTAAKG
jgi:hypothetical protein